MKHLLPVILAFLVGCTAHPRYRTGGEESLQKINKSTEKYDTEDFIRLGNIMQGYLGKPYRGASKYEQGLDCSHFVQTVFRRFDNIKLPRMAADQYQAGRDVKYKHLRYGDLVFFKTDRKKVSHVGVYIGDRDFIHVSSSRGVIISSLGETYWAERYVGARRILE
ncbi:MAG: C40 family peptidase [Candidatus Zixiibacteriota bacterium]|nr:MAG: C40 family peptidase [candidate division Zixibacteria bacterium]